ncbi:MAG TPA: F0F1 ATP synthase subunit A [Prolixibacteraceae bacterium]|nr:F0F1 ATP synthase subunit A [Prolixibacteraceae bacterium]
MIRILQILVIIVFTSFTLSVKGQEAHGTEPDGKAEHSEDFQAGKFVIEHVSDAFEWHIATIGTTEVSVPLPIILYSEQKGLNIFMSSRFHHGKESYKGFKIETEGKNEGKIVELNDQNQVVAIPWDLSITKTVAGVMVSVALMLMIFLSIAKSAKKGKNKAPSGMQNLLEPVIIFVRDEVAKPAIGEKKYERFMPFLLTVFFFILINNLLGLVPVFPFGANVTGNIAVTMVLALFTFIITTFSTNRHYWKEIYNPEVPWWLKFPIPLMPIVELTGVITKPFVLMVRLFANMLAGHLIVTVFVSMIFIFAKKMGVEAGLGVSVVSVLFSVFMVLLDVLVSFIQAYVFTLLSALYFGMASPEHH